MHGGDRVRHSALRGGRRLRRAASPPKEGCAGGGSTGPLAGAGLQWLALILLGERSAVRSGGDEALRPATREARSKKRAVLCARPCSLFRCSRSWPRPPPPLPPPSTSPKRRSSSTAWSRAATTTRCPRAWTRRSSTSTARSCTAAPTSTGDVDQGSVALHPGASSPRGLPTTVVYPFGGGDLISRPHHVPRRHARSRRCRSSTPATRAASRASPPAQLEESRSSSSARTSSGLLVANDTQDREPDEGPARRDPRASSRSSSSRSRCTATSRSSLATSRSTPTATCTTSRDRGHRRAARRRKRSCCTRGGCRPTSPRPSTTSSSSREEGRRP